MNIWQTLKKPLFILAPMEDVTDTVFRQIISSCGRPDLYFTEFTNVEGLASVGNDIVSQRLKFIEEEKPIIAQIWGKDPNHYFTAAKKLKGMGFDGIDINMGCPEKSITKNGCCAALINNHTLASEIIVATKQGAGDLPVSVKTRIGFEKIVTEEWVSFLLSFDLAALTIHGRTAKEQSTPPVHWEEIQKVVNIKESMQKETYIIGNGDILTLLEGKQKIKEYGVDGIMIGRGVFHDPFIFTGKNIWVKTLPTERLTLLEKHLNLYETTWHGKKHFPILKKYIKIYVSGFDGAGEMRAQLMESKTPQELSDRITSYKQQLTTKN